MHRDDLMAHIDHSEALDILGGPVANDNNGVCHYCDSKITRKAPHRVARFFCKTSCAVNYSIFMAERELAGRVVTYDD